MSRRYKGIIFDLDGVICFTDHYHYLAWKALADREGIAFDETINNRLRGVSRLESLNILLEKARRSYSDEEKAVMAQSKNEIYRGFLLRMSPADLDPETRKTLDELRNRGYRLAVGSSSKNTPLILSRIGLTGYFDAVSDGNNITRSKPDPEVFLKASEMLELSPGDCLVVEDAKAGIEAAMAGGFDSAAMGDAVSFDRATYALTSFSDLLVVCGG